MSILLLIAAIPRRNSSSALCFCVNNSTLNDASITMLSVRNCSRGGDDFWCVSRTTVRYMFLSPQLSLITFKWWTRSSFSVSGNVKPGVDPERSDYRTLRAERGTCFNPLQALITPPSADWIHLVFPSFKTHSSWNQGSYNTIWEM